MCAKIEVSFLFQIFQIFFHTNSSFEKGLKYKTVPFNLWYEYLWRKCLFEFQIILQSSRLDFMSSWFPAKTYNYPRKMCGLLCCFHYFVCSPIVLTLCVFTQERFAWQFKFLYKSQNHLWSFLTKAKKYWLQAEVLGEIEGIVFDFGLP